MSLSVLDSLLLGIFGIGIVFVVLVGLSLLLRLQSALVARFTNKKPAQVVAAVSATPAAVHRVDGTAACAAPVPVAEAVSSAEKKPEATGSDTISSPVSGTVIEVLAASGARVRRGQALLILDTMKMEHEIVSPRDGTIAQIVASKGASVAAGSPLVTLQ